MIVWCKVGSLNGKMNLISIIGFFLIFVMVFLLIIIGGRSIWSGCWGRLGSVGLMCMWVWMCLFEGMWLEVDLI